LLVTLSSMSTAQKGLIECLNIQWRSHLSHLYETGSFTLQTRLQETWRFDWARITTAGETERSHLPLKPRSCPRWRTTATGGGGKGEEDEEDEERRGEEKEDSNSYDQDRLWKRGNHWFPLRGGRKTESEKKDGGVQGPRREYAQDERSMRGEHPLAGPLSYPIIQSDKMWADVSFCSVCKINK